MTEASFTRVVLDTGADGRARFRDEAIPLDQGTPQVRLSAMQPSGGYQLRESPVGFASAWHCTEHPQWVFVLNGAIEIGLQDGSWRRFGAGAAFYATDTLPAGASFDPTVHGHRSRQAGGEPLVTLFVRG
jgi:hypothetical protein